MKIIKNMKKAAIPFLMATIILLGAVPALAEVIVIANKDVPANSIKRSELKEIYMGKKTTWTKNSKIAPALLKSGKTHNEFLKKYVGKTAAQFRSYWNNLLYTGTGTPPPSSKTEKEIVEYVSKNKGAIGYIDSETAHDGVKVMAVK